MQHKHGPVHVLLERICSMLSRIAELLLGLMSLLILGQVVCRNAFDLGLPWADELARFTCIALVFLAIPTLLLRNRHIAVDIVYNMLGSRYKTGLRRLNCLLTLFFCTIVLYSFYKFLIRAGKFSTPSLEMSNWVFYSPALIGIAMLAVVALYLLFAPSKEK